MTDVLGELLDEARTLNARVAAGTSPVSAGATITINANSWGIWVASVCCVAMMAVNIGLALFLARLDRVASEQGHQLNAIYMMAPHLKPKDHK